jgi:hypothetical protein
MRVSFITRQIALQALAIVALVVSLGSSAHADIAQPYPAADQLFRSDVHWLGGDVASSIELSPGRVLWLFGDSFIAPSPPFIRPKAAFVRNSIGVQEGTDARSARISFAWRGGQRPASFFADAGEKWYWPSGGAIRMPAGPLLVFLFKVGATPNQGLGFEITGYALARIENPDDDAGAWRVEIRDQKMAPFDAIPGSAVLATPPYVVVLATRQRGIHAGMWVRYDAQAFARGDLSRPEWWMGERLGWRAPEAMGANVPRKVMRDAGAESSVHWDARTRRYLHVASYGFGATRIGVRTAAKLTGPWSAPRMVYEPLESLGPKPFVYAGKAHPEQVAPNDGGLVISYVANSFEPETILSAEGQRRLYWPRFAIVPR